MAKDIVPLTQADRALLVEMARAMTPFEEEIADKWDDLYVKARNGLKEKDRAVKDYKAAVRMLLTSLSDGDFDAYFERIDERGGEFAKTREQYENLILSFHLYEEAAFPYLRASFPEGLERVLGTLDHLYHNVIAILARAYFRELEKEREKFVNIMAHDIRNILTGIIGFSNILIEKGRAGTLPKEKEEKYLNTIRDNGLRMLRLIENTLSYGRLRSGKYALNLEDFDMMDAVRSVSFSLLPGTEKAGVSISLNGLDLREAGEIPSITVKADRDLISRAVGNYLSNAVKYAGSSVSVVLEERGEDILISVWDDGPGIPPDQIDLIFGDYYMVPGGKPGTGLGLPSVRMIAELHAGKAWAESEYGNGSTFHLDLPKRPPSP